MKTIAKRTLFWVFAAVVIASAIIGYLAAVAGMILFFTLPVAKQIPPDLLYMAFAIYVTLLISIVGGGCYVMGKVLRWGYWNLGIKCLRFIYR